MYLSIHRHDYLGVLFERNNISFGEYSLPSPLDNLRPTINQATSEQLLNLLRYMASVSDALRSEISPRYRHDQYWYDLVQCLLLDGYRIEGGDMIQIEPSIEGVESFEDDFSIELRQTEFEETTSILDNLEKSAKDFLKTEPDYNGCLTNARIALETLAKSIARARQTTHTGTYNENRWGSVLKYLRISELITENEEKGLAGVYGFVSAGAHRPVGLSEQEMARLGRSLIASMCYFLVKLHNNIS